jgi:hypothetical protein
MPWNIEDVERHHKGLSDVDKRKWVAVANKQLAALGDEGRAIREANAVVNQHRHGTRGGPTV